MFNIYLGIYITVAILILLGGSMKFMGSGQTLTGVVFFIGAVIIFIVYGLKWFSKQNAIFSDTPVSWPTVINTCPDYLVQYGRQMPDGTQQDSCIDMIGVSKNGALKVFPKDGVAPTNDEYYFSLVTKSTDSVARNAELCQRAITFGLTWEGITNGESCITPSGTVAPSSSSGGNNCS
jgi:hypothetical protein